MGEAVSEPCASTPGELPVSVILTLLPLLLLLLLTLQPLDDLAMAALLPVAATPLLEVSAGVEAEGKTSPDPELSPMFSKCIVMHGLLKT